MAYVFTGLFGDNFVTGTKCFTYAEEQYPPRTILGKYFDLNAT